MSVKLEEHPIVIRHRQKSRAVEATSNVVEAAWLRDRCREAGADDVGFVEIDRSILDPDRVDILNVLPGTRTLIGVVSRLNRGPIRSPARSISNTEFHQVGDSVNHICHRIVSVLEEQGIRAVNPAAGFPMEADRWNRGKMWTVSHKRVAVAAGLGQMGIHRNVIHPRYGSFVLLGTVLMAAEVSQNDQPIEYNPCVECKLCVAACPVGAIGSDGRFDFSACYTHNYREFMGGFADWVDNIADSKNASDYRAKVSDRETVSMWQSLSFGANYKSAYCISVCPAGEDVIGPFLDNRSGFLKEVVKPLQDKEETIYVTPNSDPEEYVPKRFPNKKTKRVSNGFRPASIRQFLAGLPLAFQRNRAKGLSARYHFSFTGSESVETTTVVIRDQTLEIQTGHIGNPDIRILADSESWLGFLRKEKSLIWQLIRGKIRIKGSPRLLLQFGKCFPT
jgi:Fe-S-cluster-containing hydrogenase component 2